MADHKWTAGQTVVRYDRNGYRDEVTIERVTPSGRAVIGPIFYRPDGYVYGGIRFALTRIELVPTESPGASNLKG